MMDELAIVARARNGDSAAFELLVERYQNQVYRLALRMCGNTHDAEEVAQEAFVAAWKGLPRFRGESKFSTWLYQLTSHAAVDYLRREKRHRGLDDIDEQTDLAAEGSPHEAAENAELAGQLQAALQSLTPEHRQIFLLRQLQQLSYEEIAQTLGLEAGTVKSRLNRARKQLQQKLSEQGNFSPASSVLKKERRRSDDV